jgi:hypothetical protein
VGHQVHDAKFSTLITTALHRIAIKVAAALSSQEIVERRSGSWTSFTHLLDLNTRHNQSIPCHYQLNSVESRLIEAHKLLIGAPYVSKGDAYINKLAILYPLRIVSQQKAPSCFISDSYDWSECISTLVKSSV